MRRAIRTASVAGVLMLTVVSMANAQTRSSNTSSNGAFNPGYMDVGPVIDQGAPIVHMRQRRGLE